jgi:hypothetical protein
MQIRTRCIYSAAINRILIQFWKHVALLSSHAQRRLLVESRSSYREVVGSEAHLQLRPNPKAENHNNMLPNINLEETCSTIKWMCT